MILRRPTRLLRDRTGASAVEFALVSPIVILLLMGAINIGYYFMVANSISSAVDEAARYATIDPAPTATQVRARFDSANFASAPSSEITWSMVTASASAKTNSITISASRAVRINLVFFDLGTLNARAQRRIFVPK